MALLTEPEKSWLSKRGIKFGTEVELIDGVPELSMTAGISIHECAEGCVEIEGGKFPYSKVCTEVLSWAWS